MAASYRHIAASSFEEAKKLLKAGETLVLANIESDKPQRGHIPVTCWQTFEHGKSSNAFYARKG